MLLMRSTYDSEEAARGAARALIEARLACCAHVQALAASVYRWDGEVCEEPEWLLEARVPAAKQEAAAAAIADGHPYDTPLVEAIPVAWLEPRYADWAASVTQ
ncbi:MAG: divalent cation tolerance protein CutA [Thermoplasmatota archaeon]